MVIHRFTNTQVSVPKLLVGKRHGVDTLSQCFVSRYVRKVAEDKGVASRSFSFFSVYMR